MTKPICIFVDEPESYVTLSKLDRAHYNYVLPQLVENVAFSVFNNLFMSGIDMPLDIRRITMVLCTNIIFNYPPRGLKLDDGLCRLIRPLEEVVSLLIPVLTRLDKFNTLIDINRDVCHLQITVRNLN